MSETPRGKALRGIYTYRPGRWPHLDLGGRWTESAWDDTIADDGSPRTRRMRAAYRRISRMHRAYRRRKR